MSPAQAVHELLAATSGVTDVVGTRIYPVIAPQKAQPPFIVVTQVSEDPLETFDAGGEATLRSSRVQVDCYMRENDEAHELAAAAEDALVTAEEANGLRAWKLDSRDLFEDDTRLHRVSMDFGVMFGR